MNLIIREIQAGDSEAILNLTLQLGYNSNLPEAQDRIAKLMENETHCAFIAIFDGQICGWIHGFYTLRLHSNPFVEIGGLIVDANFRNRGIGQELVAKVKEWGFSKSVNKLRVRCNVRRAGSHDFYKALGFKEVKEQKIFDQPV